MLRSSPVVVRLLDISDRDDLLRWRNDYRTRMMSRDSDVVNSDTHNKWFSSALINQSKVIYVGLVNQIKIGVVSLDRQISYNNLWEIGVTVAPEHRGRKLGATLLIAALQKFLLIHPRAEITAYVKSENVSSQKIFVNSGFILSGQSSCQIIKYTYNEKKHGAG